MLLGGQQGQPLSFAQVPWCHDKEVSPVQGCDLADIQPLGEGYHARVHHLQAQGCVSGQQFRHAAVVMRSGFETRSSSAAIAAQNSAARPG